MATERINQFVVTEDGSLSLKDSETGELFHNRAGAWTEALKNFVEPLAIERWIKDIDPLLVLDVCFGLGYNSFVLLERLSTLTAEKIKITAIEKDPSLTPLVDEILLSGKFPSLSRSDHSGRLKVQRADGGVIDVEFEFLTEDVRQVVPRLDREGRKFDLVFHDPFSPRRMPELWTVDLFHCYFRMLRRPHGRLVTYSSAGSVRGGLRSAGFSVLRTEALGGKSGGTLAHLAENRDAPNAVALSDQEEARLRSRSGLPLRDPDFTLTREEILKLRDLEQKNFK